MPVYLESNNQSLQKTIGGGVAIGAENAQKHVEISPNPLFIVKIMGAIDCSSHAPEQLIYRPLKQEEPSSVTLSVKRVLNLFICGLMLD
jgi:hypothetical protein